MSGRQAPIARYRALCLDACDPARLGRFYAEAFALQLAAAPSGTVLRGPGPQHTVWINAVPEGRTTKNRVHVDVHTADVTRLVAAGARVLNDGDFRWIVLADPEGHELCAFVREQPPPLLLYELVVDCVDPIATAGWWGLVLGAEPGGDPSEGWAWLEPVPGAPFAALSFVPVPEPKTAKNRVHWDLTGDAAALIAAGAQLLRPRDDQRAWDVLADPEGNEFCVFPG